MGRIRSCRILRIFTVAFLLLLAPEGNSNPAGLFKLLLNLTHPKIISFVMRKYEETRNFGFFPLPTKCIGHTLKWKVQTAFVDLQTSFDTKNIDLNYRKLISLQMLYPFLSRVVCRFNYKNYLHHKSCAKFSN